MEVLAALIGAGIVAASPFVPVLRPVAKAAVKGGLAVTEAAVGVASAVGHQVNEAVSKVKADAEAAETDAEVEADATQPDGKEEVDGQKAGLGSLTAALRPTVVSALKHSAAVTDKAKEAAVGAGKQWGELVSEARQSQKAQAGESVVAEAVDAQQEPAAETPAEPSPPPGEDDLVEIRGVGPKTAALLNNAGITTYAQLAEADEAELREILGKGGTRYRSINPTDWPEQARQMVEAT